MFIVIRDTNCTCAVIKDTIKNPITHLIKRSYVNKKF